MKTRIVVSAIIEKDGKLLFGKKKPNTGPYPNTWVIIGGGVKMEEENIEEALKREVKEEVNIEIDNIKHLSFDEDYEPDKNNEKTHYIFLVYTAIYKSGKPKPGDDIVELLWIEKSKLSTIALSRPTIKLFKELNWIT